MVDPGTPTTDSRRADTTAVNDTDLEDVPKHFLSEIAHSSDYKQLQASR